jgi:hypothetical protein
MVYLVKDEGKVREFHSAETMKASGYKKADLVVSEEIYNSNGCYARIINGSVIVGKTDEEIEEAERQAQVSEYKAQLEQIDKDAMASRAVRELVLELADRAGIQSDAVEILQGYETRAEPIRTQLSPLLLQAETA